MLQRRAIRAAAARTGATIRASRRSTFRVRCSRAAHTCVRRTTAADIARPLVTPSRSTPPPPMSVSAASGEQGTQMHEQRRERSHELTGTRNAAERRASAHDRPARACGPAPRCCGATALMSACSLAPARRQRGPSGQLTSRTSSSSWATTSAGSTSAPTTGASCRAKPTKSGPTRRRGHAVY